MAVTVVLVIVLSLAPTAFADTSLTLYQIPSGVNEGQTVTFTGVLYADGRPLANKVVYIQESDPGPDEVLAQGRTDQNGRFSIQWRAEAATFEINFDIYAIFEGDSSHKKDRTRNQYMDVYERSKSGGSIALDRLPHTVKTGQVVTFSGMLKLNNGNPQGSVVYIKDEDSFSRDELLASAYVESNGRFSVKWIAKNTDRFDNSLEIFAVFEGNSKHKRMTTCGELCGGTMSLRISGHVGQQRASPNSSVPDGSRYNEMFYALSMPRSPHVAIVTDPGNNRVNSHIMPVKKGIEVWVDALEGAYGRGNWDVTFEHVPAGDRFNSKPDVIVTLVTAERDSRCGIDYAGYASVSSNPPKPVHTVVCSEIAGGGGKYSNQQVMRTAGHEFMHAMGLGHAFNKPGDVMCSVENGVPTCQGAKKSNTPSRLNLQAVAKIYGTDGFKNPNNYVKYKDRFTEGGYTGGSSKVQPPSTPPQTRTASFPNGCSTDNARYDYDVNNLRLNAGVYRYYTICNEGTVQYSFSATSRGTGFTLHVIPPDTNVRDYISRGIGNYYVCEDPDKQWSSKSGRCNVDVGSRIIIHNDRDVSVTVNGKIRT